MEILIVMLVIGLLTTIAVPGINSLTHLKLRKSTLRVAGIVKYLYNQAAMKGLCMRLVFDLENDLYYVESTTDGKCMIGGEKRSSRQAKQKEKDDKKKAKKKLEEAQSNSSSSFSESSFGGWEGEKPISLEMKKATFTRLNKGLLKPRKLPQGVRIHGIFTSRQTEIYTKKEGPKFAYIHCFPLGLCERAIVFLEDRSGSIFSIEVKPLSGRSVIHGEKIKLKEYHKNRKKGADDDS